MVSDSAMRHGHVDELPGVPEVPEDLVGYGQPTLEIIEEESTTSDEQKILRMS